MPPFLILAIGLIIYLPQEHKSYAFLAIIVFWIIYYTWIFIEKKRLTKK